MGHLRLLTVTAAVAIAMAATIAGTQRGATSPVSRAIGGPVVACGGSCGRAVSLDGRFVAYRARGEKGASLFVKDLRSEQQVTVAVETAEAEPSFDLAWSPDSRRLAYRWITKRNDETAELRAIAADGSDMRVLAPADRYAALHDWSFDGESLLVGLTATGQGNGPVALVLVTLASSAKRSLASQNVVNAFFAPDGQRVVYTQQAVRSTGDVRIVDLGNGVDRPLVASAADEAALGWSPDASEVLVTIDEDLWAVRPGTSATGSRRLLKRGLGSVVPMGVTAPGDVAYFAPRNSKIFRLPLDSSSGRVSGPPDRLGGPHAQETPRWSPTGQELAFSTGAGRDVIAIVSIDAGKQRELRPGIDWVAKLGLTRFEWSADGRSFLVEGGPQPEGTARPKGAYLVDAQTGEARMVISKPVNPAAVSFVKNLPDGRSVVYLDLWRSVVVRDLESGNERIVYDGGATNAVDSLAVSPDGRMLAFRGQKGTIVQVLPMTGGAPRTAATINWREPQTSPLTWSADGRFVLFVSRTADGELAELWRVAPTGGEPERLGFSTDRTIYSFVAHPGGRSLAVAMDGEPAGARMLERLFPPAPQGAVASAVAATRRLREHREAGTIRGAVSLCGGDTASTGARDCGMHAEPH